MNKLSIGLAILTGLFLIMYYYYTFHMQDVVDGLGDKIVSEINDPVICCRAMTATCLACSSQMTVVEYCVNNPDTTGCPFAGDQQGGEGGWGGTGISFGGTL